MGTRRKVSLIALVLEYFDTVALTVAEAGLEVAQAVVARRKKDLAQHQSRYVEVPTSLPPAQEAQTAPATVRAPRRRRVAPAGSEAAPRRRRGRPRKALSGGPVSVGDYPQDAGYLHGEQDVPIPFDDVADEAAE